MKPQADLGLLKRGAEIIGTGRRWHFAGLAILALAVAVIEAAAALIIFALIGMLNDPGSLPTFPVIGELGDLTGDVEVTRRFFLLAAGLFFVCRGVLAAYQRYALARFGESVGREVSGRLFRGYLDMPYEEHLERNSAQLIRTALWSVNEVVINLIIPALAIFSEVFVLAALITTLLIASPLGVIISVVAVAPVVLLVLRIVQPKLHRLGRRAEDDTETAHRQFSQPLEGIRDVKVLQKQGFFSGQFDEARSRLARARYLAATLHDLPRLALETTVFLLVIGVLGFLQAEEGGSLALLGIFGYALVRLLPGVNRIVAAASRIRFGRAAVDNVFRDLVQISSLEDERARASSSSKTARPLAFHRSIRLDGMGFTYRGASRPAVEDISLEIARGQFVGIVGPTGSGKTTLMDLIAGLLEPSLGSILVDDVDIRTDLSAWQAKIGLVPQNVFLIDDTLRRNIALGIESESTDNHAMTKAVEAAQLSEFILALPEGLDTVVGERGARVSGGQRQRVAIARALYPQPELLLFDEGTASLDTLTEAALLHALEGLRGEYTMVTIAHRLASVRTCDVIFMLDHGRLVDQGTYQDLLRRNPTFERMAR